jgi:hypothetical protein
MGLVLFDRFDFAVCRNCIDQGLVGHWDDAHGDLFPGE